MKNLLIALALPVVLLFSCPGSFAKFGIYIYKENIAIGLSGAYNFQTGGLGLGLRGHVAFSERLSATIQIPYYPAMNKIHELYTGLSVQYIFFRWWNLKVYAHLGGYCNFWLNSGSSDYNKAKPINLAPFAGLGVSYGYRCIQPFIEHQYNPIWKEGSIHVGVLWFPWCKGSKGRMPKSKKYKGTRCPAY